MHTNICSVNKNLESLGILTHSLAHKLYIKTWITKHNESSNDRLSLPGYQRYIGTNGQSLKGGCGFFVSDELVFQPREDLNISHRDNDSEFEANWIEIKTQTNNNFLIAVLYRHPQKKNDAKFLEYLTNVISNKIRKENKTVFITGDFNINLLNIDSDEYTETILY